MTRCLINNLSCLHGHGEPVHRSHDPHSSQPSCDVGGPCVAQRSGPGSAEPPVPLDLLSFPAQQRDQRCLEAVPEVGAEEPVDARVDAAVEVGQQVKCCTHRLQISIIESVQNVERGQEVVDENGCPANDEENHHGYQHFDDLHGIVLS
ncbi:hypothetical protein JTE90_003539 [Oedothorax gibbosus]|uniref:Uncharacterized protein n=1 Tax=Oedothorax gibbosus TaxID=931172 RepID=A0AAV6UQS2_9ARAC|nr:hypothetical protein JTE90_003539 [Oedothorax gibbosus]